jgi:hypothetical protein
MKSPDLPACVAGQQIEPWEPTSPAERKSLYRYRAQREALDARIRTLSRSHIVHPGLPQFADGKRARVDVASIPGARPAVGAAGPRPTSADASSSNVSNQQAHPRMSVLKSVHRVVCCSSCSLLLVLLPLPAPGTRVTWVAGL